MWQVKTAEFLAYLHAFARERDPSRRADTLAEILDGIAVFWLYAPSNQWLIRTSYRGATRVAGRKYWAP